MAALAACLLALSASTAGAPAVPAAGARLVWSGPRLVDPHGSGGPQVIACPTVARCIALDSAGRLLSFDPGRRRMPPPAPPAAPIEMPVIACTPDGVCLVAGESGSVHVFLAVDPGVGFVRRVAPDGFAAAGAACPTASLCVVLGAVGRGERALAFDPRTRTGAVRVVRLPSETGRLGDVLYTALACPAATQCTAITEDSEVTFAPGGRAPRAVTPIARAGTRAGYLTLLDAVACPASNECVAVNLSAFAVAFDPAHPLGRDRIALPAKASDSANAIACASSASCTTVTLGGWALTFDPRSRRLVARAWLTRGAGVPAISCPSLVRCVAVAGTGRALRFAPGSPQRHAAILIDPGEPLTAVACPSLDSCTAASVAGSLGGRVITFDTGSRRRPVDRTLPKQLTPLPHGIACPSASVCTAVYDRRAVTFAPWHGPISSPLRSPPSAGVVNFAGPVACPGVRVCVTISLDPRDGESGAVTYDPSFRQVLSAGPLGRDVAVSGLSCPSTRQCTTIVGARAVTFDATGERVIATVPIDPGVVLHGADPQLSCPTVALCVLVGADGDEVSFHPRSTQPTHPVTIDPSAALNDIDCPTATGCVAIDSNGRVLTGAPGARRWTAIQVGAGELDAITCPAASQCVAVDGAGDAYIGRAG